MAARMAGVGLVTVSLRRSMMLDCFREVAAAFRQFGTHANTPCSWIRLCGSRRNGRHRGILERLRWEEPSLLRSARLDAEPFQQAIVPHLVRIGSIGCDGSADPNCSPSRSTRRLHWSQAQGTRPLRALHRDRAMIVTRVIVHRCIQKRWQIVGRSDTNRGYHRCQAKWSERPSRSRNRVGAVQYFSIVARHPIRAGEVRNLILRNSGSVQSLAGVRYTCRRSVLIGHHANP